MILPEILAIGGIFILGIWALFKLQQNFSMRLFYTIGVWLFLIQLLANTYGFYMDFNLLPAWARISRVGSLLFTALLTYLFYYLRKTAPASMGGAGTQLSPEEINAFLDDEEEAPKKEAKKKTVERKNGLRRPCDDCKLYYYPTGKSSRLCEACKKIRHKKLLERRKLERQALKEAFNGEA